MTAEISLTRRGFLVGENIPFVVTIDNKSNKKAAARIILLQVIFLTIGCDSNSNSNSNINSWPNIVTVIVMIIVIVVIVVIIVIVIVV